MKSNLTPWREREGTESPFLSLQREINRMFDDFDRGFELPILWRTEKPFAVPSFTPLVDVKERDTAFEVTAELPGIAPEDVEVTLKENRLTISGKKDVKHEEEKENFYRMERSFGSFVRTLPLPANLVDSDKVEASFDKGVLTIVLPKLPEVWPAAGPTAVKQIPIKQA